MEKIKEKNVWIPIYLSIYLYIHIKKRKKNCLATKNTKNYYRERERESAKELIFGGCLTQL